MPNFQLWFQDHIRDERVSRSEFARRIGMPARTVTAWYNGERIPDPDSCRKIADALPDVDEVDVLIAAGHKTPERVYDPDDPVRRLIAAVEKVEWTPEREKGALGLLRAWMLPRSPRVD